MKGLSQENSRYYGYFWIYSLIMHSVTHTHIHRKEKEREGEEKTRIDRERKTRVVDGVDTTPFSEPQVIMMPKSAHTLLMQRTAVEPLAASG